MNNHNNEFVNDLPTFVITMLGGSGVGKTVFMACMYVALSARNDLSIEAEPNLDKDLREIYRNIVDGKLPPGTVVVESKYDFYLLVDSHRIAKINWIDYRGGAIEDNASEDDASYLHERIRESDAVLIMLDLSSETLKDFTVGGTQANDYLKIGRIRNLINTQNADKRIKSVIYVRTKSDLVKDESGKLNLKSACDELIAQLNNNTSFRNVPICAAIAVSSCKVTQDENNEKKVQPGDPLNTEWVLFVALKDLLLDIKNSFRNEIKKLKKQLERIEEEKRGLKNKSISFKDIFWGDSVRQKELELSREADEVALKISEKDNSLDKLIDVIEKIDDKIPYEQVRIFHNIAAR